MDQKVLGYLLLTAGLLLIAFSTLNIFQVYSGQLQPYKLFDQKSLRVDIKSLMGQGEASLPAGSEEADSSLELLSGKSVNTSLNLTFQLILMSFIAGSGYKVASLGTRLLRPINVKL